MTTSRPMRADARRNHERIVATAREAFVEHGPDVPLDDIVRRSGVGAGTLYRHFPSREALIEAVYREDIQLLSDSAHRLLDEHDPAQALELWMREQVRYAVRKRGIIGVLKAAMDRDPQAFTFCRKLMHDAAAALLEATQRAGLVRPEIQPRDLLLLAHSVGLGAEISPEAAERLTTVMLDGLKPPRP